MRLAPLLLLLAACGSDVEYRVSGDATTARVGYFDGSGFLGQKFYEGPLPFDVGVDLEDGALAYVSAISVDTVTRTITCEIWQDGRMLTRETLTGIREVVGCTAELE